MISSNRINYVPDCRIVCLFVLLGIFSGLANAAESYTTSNSRWTNTVSGFPTNVFDEWIVEDGFALNMISGRETSALIGNDSNDHPAILDLGAHELCAAGDACIGHLHKRFKIEDSNPASNRTATLGARRYMTGLKVCLNNRNQVRDIKLKGIKIYGGPIRDNGTINTSRTSEFHRPNCAKWSNKVQCGPKKYISGIRAFRGQKGFTGIAIHCSRARPVQSSAIAIQSSKTLKRKK